MKMLFKFLFVASAFAATSCTQKGKDNAEAAANNTAATVNSATAATENAGHKIRNRR